MIKNKEGTMEVRVKEKVKKIKSKKDILENLKMSELEEGRKGLVDDFLKKNPELKKENDK